MNRGPRKIPTELTDAEKLKVDALVLEFYSQTSPVRPETLKELARLGGGSWHPEADSAQLILDYLNGDEYAEQRQKWNATIKQVRRESMYRQMNVAELLREGHREFHRYRRAQQDWLRQRKAEKESPMEKLLSKAPAVSYKDLQKLKQHQK